MVLPALGGETINPRCPKPMGEIRSRTRVTISLELCSRIDSLNRVDDRQILEVGRVKCLFRWQAVDGVDPLNLGLRSAREGLGGDHLARSEPEPLNERPRNLGIIRAAHAGPLRAAQKRKRPLDLGIENPLDRKGLRLGPGHIDLRSSLRRWVLLLPIHGWIHRGGIHRDRLPIGVVLDRSLIAILAPPPAAASPASTLPLSLDLAGLAGHPELRLAAPRLSRLRLSRPSCRSWSARHRHGGRNLNVSGYGRMTAGRSRTGTGVGLLITHRDSMQSPWGRRLSSLIGAQTSGCPDNRMAVNWVILPVRLELAAPRPQRGTGHSFGRPCGPSLALQRLDSELPIPAARHSPAAPELFPFASKQLTEQAALTRFRLVLFGMPQQHHGVFKLRVDSNDLPQQL